MPKCNYCGGDCNGSGMCDSCDKRMNGTTHAERKAAPFGWTVVRRRSSPGDTCKLPYKVYRRDKPADAAHFAEDLAPFTHASKRKAIEAGQRGEYAYKR